FLFILLIMHLPRSNLFPYTTLFRSHGVEEGRLEVGDGGRGEIHAHRRRHAAVPAMQDGVRARRDDLVQVRAAGAGADPTADPRQDRKSTRLNSSHVAISYAVFCLKK